MKVSSTRLALLAAGSSLCVGVASAQAAQTTEASGLEDVVVVTASRTQLEAREIGSAITTITSADLQKEQVLFIKDALQDIPGVQISSQRPGGTNNISIRGSDNDQVLFLLDGIELGDPSSTSTQFQTDHITSLDVGRIEVLRGNQSSLYGSDAVGGVVNIITQRATSDGFQINAQAEIGSENSRSGGATLLGKSGVVDYRLTATAFGVDGPSVADPNTSKPTATEDDAYERTGLSGRVGYQIADGLEAQIVGFYSETSSDLDNTTRDSLNTVDKDEYGAAVQFKHVTVDAGWRNEFTLSRYNAQRLYFGTSNLASGDLYDGVKDAALYATSFRFSPMVDVAGGLNWEEETTKQVTRFSGNLQAGVTTKSAFIELAFRPLEALSFTAAARVDDNSRFGAFDTYRVTGTWFMSRTLAGGDVKLRASYGSGAKAPGLYQLFDPTYGNADLQVETSEGYDAGIDVAWDKAQLELTVFANHVTNEIAFDGAIVPSGGYVQFGETEARGVEFGARVELAPFAYLTQTFTALDSQNVITDRWRGRPRLSGSTGVTFQITPAWDLSARVRYRSENASTSTGRTRGFQTVDILTSYDINETFEVYGRIVNASDADFQMTYGTNAPDRGVFAGVRVRL